MNLQAIQNRNSTPNTPILSHYFSPDITSIRYARGVLHPISATGFHDGPIRASISRYDWENRRSSCSACPNYSNPHSVQSIKLFVPPSSTFNLGFRNTGNWVSCKRMMDSRNGAGALVKVRCGGGPGEGENDQDRYYMRKAVELAREATGYTSPNPMVGCVIVKDGKIVGEGFHPKAGQPHAEVFALRAAGELAENATAYVSLEPCNHYGKTPPCSEALLKAKVKRVVVGMIDPNPIVASRGVSRLRDAGIEVVVGVEENLCKELLEAWTHKMLTGKPFVTLRYSISVNGLVLEQLGEGAVESGGYYSKLLQEYDAIIYSSAAIGKELSFPASKEPKANQPLQILIAKNPVSCLKIPESATESTSKTVIFTDKEAAVSAETAELGVETVSLDCMSLDAILEYCSKQGSCSVLLDIRGKVDDLEEIVKEAFEKDLVQKIVVEVLPVWGGEEESISLQLGSLTNRMGLRSLSTRGLGKSVLLEGYL